MCLAASLSSSSGVVPGGDIRTLAGTNIGLKEGKSALGASKLGLGNPAGGGIIGAGKPVEGIKMLANLLVGQDLQYHCIAQGHTIHIALDQMIRKL